MALPSNRDIDYTKPPTGVYVRSDSDRELEQLLWEHVHRALPDTLLLKALLGTHTAFRLADAEHKQILTSDEARFLRWWYEHDLRCAALTLHEHDQLLPRPCAHVEGPIYANPARSADGFTVHCAKCGLALRRVPARMARPPAAPRFHEADSADEDE